MDRTRTRRQELLARATIEVLEDRRLLSAVTSLANTNVGSPALNGSSSFHSGSGTWSVSGGGTDIWSTADQFNLASNSVSGDVVLVARVASMGNTDGWAKAGVMVRNGTAANAAYAGIFVTPSNGLIFQYRTSTGASASGATVGALATPYWVKVVRQGSTFAGYYSSGGSGWTQLGTTQSIAMSASVNAGLAVTSHNAGQLNTSTFTNVILAPTIVTQATSSPPSVSAGQSVALSVLATDGDGEASLTYTWKTLGTPPAPVSFASNGTNAAKNTAATFTVAGTYSLQVDVTNAQGQVTSSTTTVAVTAAQVPASHVNVAQFQAATASATLAGYASAYATDGIVRNDSSWRANGTGPHWLAVNLPTSQTVRSAQLYLGTDDGAPLSSFSLQYLNGSTWTNVPGATFSGNTATVLNVPFSSAVTASQFRLYTTASSPIVREVALFASNSYPIGTDVKLNLAKNQPATASTAAGTNYAINAVDGYLGDDASAWKTTSANGPHTLAIDLTTTVRVASAHLYSGSTTAAAVDSFKFQYWTGSAWVDIAGSSVTGNTQKERVVTFSAPVATSRVQLVILSNGTQVVREVGLFAASTGVTTYSIGTNVLDGNRPATSYTTFADTYYGVVNQSNNLGLVTSSSGAGQVGIDAGNGAQQYQMLYDYATDSYRLRNRQSGLVLAAQNAGTASGTGVVEVAYSNAPHQRWTLVNAGGGYYRIVNAWNGLAIETNAAAPAVVSLAPSSGIARQLWRFDVREAFPKKGIAGAPSEARAAAMGNSWVYNWSPAPTAPQPAQTSFFPMQFSDANVGSLWTNYSSWHTDSRAVNLLGFNEPDMPAFDQWGNFVGGSDMTTARAVAAWPYLQAMGVPLVSPAVAVAQNGWMADFLGQANARGYRVDYTAVHLYSYPSVDGFMGYLQYSYDNFGKPVYLSEFGAASTDPFATWSEEDNYRFVAEFMWRAQGVSWIKGYNLFAFEVDEQANPWTRAQPRSAVYKADGATLTALGKLYAGWQGDTTVRSDRPYMLLNQGATHFLRNTGSGLASGSIRVDDTSVQWSLVAAPTAGRFYIVSASDGRRLSYNGTTLSYAAAGAVGAAVEWSYSTPDANGYSRIASAVNGQLLAMNRTNDANGAPTALTFSMAAAGTTTSNVNWRFVAPYQPSASTGLVNTSFEAPSIGAAHYVYNPPANGWTFNGTSGVASNGSFFGNPNAVEGTQVLFLQGNAGQPSADGTGVLGAISQATTLPAGTYKVTFQAARRGGTQIQPVALFVNGVQQGAVITPTSGNFATYSTATFTVAAGTHTISLRATTNSGDNTTFVDQVSLVRTVPIVTDAGFESPAVPAGGFVSSPSGTGWTFKGSAGIQANGSAWGAPVAPDGTRTAYLQSSNGGGNAGKISQVMNFSTTGTFTLTLRSALRSYGGTGQRLGVYLDGVLISTITPASTTAWSTHNVALSIATIGLHTLTLAALVDTGDQSLFVDGIALV